MGEIVVDNLKTVLDAGVQLGKAATAGDIRKGEGGIPFVVTSAGQLQAVEYLLINPTSKRAVTALHDADSFVGYVNRFKDAGTVVFADIDNRKFECVMDFHGATGGDEGPRWGKHRALYTSETTLEWDAWMEKNGKAMTQVDFARFIEDRIPNIAEPSGADLLEMCLKLEAKKDVSFKSYKRLDNGEHQFQYEEQINGSTGAQNGTMKIPNAFTVVIEPFRGVGGKSIEARFRYRINSAQLALWFELVRPDDVLQEAFDLIVDDVRGALGATPVLAGVAPTIT